MSENAIAYLKENKEKFSKEILIASLKKTGYTDVDIAQSVALVYDKQTVASSGPKKYNTIYEKCLDLVLGFCLTVFMGIFSMIVPIFGPIIMLIFMVYIFNKRRYVFYGMIIVPLVAIPLLMISFSQYF